MEWDQEEATSSVALVEQDLEQQSRYQNVDQEVNINSPIDFPPLPAPPTPPLWDQHPHGDNWSHNDVNNPFLVFVFIFISDFL